MRIDVDYYDDSERDLFTESEGYEELEQLVRSGVEIDPFEFLATSMFMEQKGLPSWYGRDELRERAMGRLGEFEEYFDCNASIHARFDASDMENHRIERAGVGAAISAMDQAFDTHAADWEKIPVSQDKDLDFRVASTGERFVTVEAKGSIVEDPTKKTPSISNHKKHIKEKKEHQAEARGAERLIGTILAIPNDSAHMAKLWLVDPPINLPFTDPRRFRVLARYRFYERMLRMLGEPRLLIALADRLRVLDRLTDIAVLDSVPLAKVNGERFKVPHSFFAPPRAHTPDHRISAIPTWVGDDLYLLGLHVRVIRVIVSQSHQAICEWSAPPSRRSRRFVVPMTPSQARRLGFEVYDEESERLVTRTVHVDTWLDSSGAVLGRHLAPPLADRPPADPRPA